MPESLHDEITRKFDGEQAKRELFRTWLAGHPCPTWDHVEGLLGKLESEGRGREGAAEEVEETYLKSELLYFVSYMYMYMYMCQSYLYMYVGNDVFKSTQGNCFLCNWLIALIASLCLTLNLHM